EVLSGRPQAPQPEASSDEVEELADVSLPEDFDAELEKLLSGDGHEHAPREDEQGGLRTPGTAAGEADTAEDAGSGEDGNGSGDGSGDETEGPEDGPGRPSPDGDDGRGTGPRTGGGRRCAGGARARGGAGRAGAGRRRERGRERRT